MHRSHHAPTHSPLAVPLKVVQKDVFFFGTGPSHPFASVRVDLYLSSHVKYFNSKCDQNCRTVQPWMVSLGVRVHHHVIKIHIAMGHIPQHQLHQTLKSTRCIPHAKGHYGVLQEMVRCYKR